MSKLDSDARDHLQGREFALPEQRKEPPEDASHIRNAVAQFKQVKGHHRRRARTGLEADRGGG